jgi:uncharacterized protein YxjI
MHSAFTFKQYLLKRQVLALTGKFRLYTPDGSLVFFSQQRMFQLKEDIRVYSDEQKSQELLLIKARHIIDFSAAYDVYDPLEQRKVGVLRRKGFRSLLRDEWELLDANERLIGVLIEDNVTRALLRRFLLGIFLPQDYDLLIDGQRAADFKQRFNLFRYELDVDLSQEAAHKLDARLALAGAILLGTIEGRQD